MSVHYKRFLKVLEKWPVDKSKSGRDLGEHLREQFKSILAESNINAVKSDNLDKQFEALDRLSRNIYAEKYPRIHNSTASGLTGDQCKQILTTEFLRYLQEENSK
ncbi:Ubiquinol-cytochrome-c reductase complex assembly factor 2 [Pseudolycoriella hygida]|uniref:Mitochondrial nucleoid factor 1 n=1 Tax=Pseudolycoriella hygida TaxID=35572 RepID=A0A9Q0RZI3_9DIPT|nr:Ubiquinol-cytochrome-c reductase complex assembly factor 2 [Pseudolycoriella hygida]